jgi:signal transduction histidine kinase
MIFKRDPSKVVQVGFLALLFVSVLMVGFWITDNVRYTSSVQRRIEALADDNSRIPAFIAELEAESASRSNRYIWEGGFFLAVLLGGMAVLTRTIRHDAELRRRQQNFLAAVSHEFKSPLASMQLAAETLVMRAQEQDGKRLGQRILDDGERLLRMVDNLLDTTRLEEGRHTIEPERVTLAEAARAVVGAQSDRAAERGIVLDVDVPADLELSVDRAALETIMRNLVDNAIKACIASSGKRVALSAARDAGRITLFVEDDGLGFPPEDAVMMFEKFYRLGDEQRRSTPGTGLGLYIVKRLVELLGANVSAFSEGPGRGARVTVTWPAAIGTRPAHDAAAAAQPGART